ncbi:hypothetical protein V5097_22455 [Arenibacter palladensis]|uniref:hypothetical protein n=1 Tax=Arenibacter palladensis TaxID=237373 RepID=UPI002FCE70D3
MTDKKIYQYTNVELLDLIKNGQNKTLVETAKSELDKRNLTQEKLKIAESEYIKFLEFKEKRKDEPLTRDEWISLFFLPFITPNPSWRKDHFSESEFQRFEKYGFDKKAKQASEVKILGFLFWFVIVILGIVIARYLKL